MFSPGVRSAGPDVLSLALIDARNRSLRLIDALDAAGAAEGGPQPEPAVAPPGTGRPLWWLGHAGWFAEYWIMRNSKAWMGAQCPRDPLRLASVEPEADRWWSLDARAGAAQWALDLPTLAETKSYLLQTLEATLSLLYKMRHDDRALYFFRLALLYEDQCAEQLAVLAQALGLGLDLELPAGVRQRAALAMPATRWALGAHRAAGFSFDHEQWSHEVSVPAFEIDAQAVSWSQYIEFVEDGGYDSAHWWQPEGWQWLQAEQQREGRLGPRYVEQIGVARSGRAAGAFQSRFGKALRMGGDQVAMHVSWWEADAWCRWAGRRLPAEVEWEIAAHQATGRGFHWGDVHEWTAGTLRPWPGYAPGPCGMLAEPWFARARVLRGASFATPPRLRAPKARGFALPHEDRGFVGFRSCAR